LYVGTVQEVFFGRALQRQRHHAVSGFIGSLGLVVAGQRTGDLAQGRAL
jgi:hypothetical protein